MSDVLISTEMSSVDILKDIEGGGIEGVTITKSDDLQSISYEKQFKRRNSVLTDLKKDTYVRLIYRILVIAFFLSYARSVLKEIVANERVTFGLKYIIRSYEDFPEVIILWLLMFISTLSVCPIFAYWAHKRKEIASNGFVLKLWITVGLILYFSYFSIMLWIPFIVTGKTFGILSKILIFEEQVRLLMKMYAFIRTNASPVLSYKPHSDMKLISPKCSHFIYFLFAPTFIYKHNYPRTAKIKWKAVVFKIVEFTFLIIWLNILFDSIERRYKLFGQTRETYYTLTIHLLETMLISPFIILFCFYAFVHVWMNLWAELMRYADRLFYEDWWNTTNYVNLYRSWNLIIYGYTHTYIYKDIVKYILPGQKVLPTFIVIILSGLVQEYIISLTLEFCVPVILIFYLSTFLKTFIPTDSQYMNYLFLFSYIVDSGLIISFYTIEYFARQNCPLGEESVPKYFEVRSLSCGGFNSTE